MASPVDLDSQNLHVQQVRTCCLKPNEKATAIALAVLGTCLLCVGIYLMFGGIGTIPSALTGFGFSLAGLAGIVSSVVTASKR